MKVFRVLYNGNSIIVTADSLHQAKLKSIKHFKVPKKKQGLLSVVSSKSMEKEEYMWL